jgi:hypothetical protein
VFSPTKATAGGGGGTSSSSSAAAAAAAAAAGGEKKNDTPPLDVVNLFVEVYDVVQQLMCCSPVNEILHNGMGDVMNWLQAKLKKTPNAATSKVGGKYAYIDGYLMLCALLHANDSSIEDTLICSHIEDMFVLEKKKGKKEHYYVCEVGQQINRLNPKHIQFVKNWSTTFESRRATMTAALRLWKAYDLKLSTFNLPALYADDEPVDKEPEPTHSNANAANANAAKESDSEADDDPNGVDEGNLPEDDDDDDDDDDGGRDGDGKKKAKRKGAKKGRKRRSKKSKEDDEDYNPSAAAAAEAPGSASSSEEDAEDDDDDDEKKRGRAARAKKINTTTLAGTNTFLGGRPTMDLAIPPPPPPPLPSTLLSNVNGHVSHANVLKELIDIMEKQAYNEMQRAQQFKSIFSNLWNTNNTAPAPAPTPALAPAAPVSHRPYDYINRGFGATTSPSMLLQPHVPYAHPFASSSSSSSAAAAGAAAAGAAAAGAAAAGAALGYAHPSAASSSAAAAGAVPLQLPAGVRPPPSHIVHAPLPLPNPLSHYLPAPTIAHTNAQAIAINAARSP